MSHISKIEVEINDLLALKQACKVMGLTFCENKKTFTWYSGQGECSHVIQVPGARYEVGVVSKGQTFELLWDDWYSGGLVQKLGENACNLRKHYSLERIKNEAKKKNYHIREQTIEHGTRLTLTA